MSGSNKHQCRLCGNETYEIFAHSRTVPEVISFRAYRRLSAFQLKGLDIELRICPNCGHIQGEVLGNGEC